MADARSGTAPSAPALSEAELHETLDLMGKLMASLSERVDRQGDLLDALAVFAEAVLSDNPPLTPTLDAEEHARRLGERLEAHMTRPVQDLHRLQAAFHADVRSAHAVFDAVREHKIALRQELFRKQFKRRFWDRPALHWLAIALIVVLSLVLVVMTPHVAARSEVACSFLRGEFRDGGEVLGGGPGACAFVEW